MSLINKKARFEYELTGEGVEAGLSLKGAEAKSLRENRGDLSQAFAKIMGNEIYLVNANIPASGLENYDSTRTRKDRKSTRLNSSHIQKSRMPSSA